MCVSVRKNTVCLQQASGVDSPSPEKTCGTYEKKREKGLTVSEKTIEKNLESR